MTETTPLTSVLDGSSQPKGSTKSVDVVDSMEVKQNEDLPVDDREVPALSDGTNTGEFFSPPSKEEEGESRTGPSIDVSSRTTKIVATTVTELITTETTNPSMDKRQDEDDSSSSDATAESKKKRSISKSIIGSLKDKMTKKLKNDTENDAELSQPSEVDDEIMLVREGCPDSENNDSTKSSSQHLVEMDDEIMLVREGSPSEVSRIREGPPPLTSIQLSKSEDLLEDLDDEIFQVREGKPKSALKKATSAVSKKVRFAFGAAKKGASDGVEFGRRLDTLLVDSDDEEDDEDGLVDQSPEVTSADFLNDLQKQSVEYELAEGVDGNSVGSYDSTGTNSTDGQSVHFYDCWELACV